MRKKVGVETLRRENGETKQSQELPQTNLDKKTNSEVSEMPLNGNHTEEPDEDFEEDEKEDSPRQPQEKNQDHPLP